MEKWIGYQKGLNLGGWFSQCDYSEERFQSFITEADFSDFSQWGIDHVRIPIDYNLVETEDGEYIESGFAHIQRAIDWCGKYGLNMILDLHKTAGYSFDFDADSKTFFEELFADGIRVAKERGIGHAAWSHKEMDFGLSDKRPDQIREEIISLL